MNEWAVLAPVVGWISLIVLYLRETPRSRWIGIVVGCLATVAATIVIALWRELSPPATVIILTVAPLTAISVTAGHPARLIDPSFFKSPDEVSDEDWSIADRYAWRAIVVLVVLTIVVILLDASLVPG